VCCWWVTAAPRGLDLFGPAEAFSEAGRRLGAPAYEVIIASAGGGPIVLTSGASVATRRLASIRPQAGDTVRVVGGADRALEEAVSVPDDQRPRCRRSP